MRLILSLFISIFSLLLTLDTVALEQKPQGKKEQVKQLSLREAVLLSMRFNPNVRNAEIDRIIKKFDLRVAQNAFELQYSLGGSIELVNNSTNKQGDPITGMAQPVAPNANANVVQQGNTPMHPTTFNRFGVTPGVEWTSPYGTKVKVGASLGKAGRAHESTVNLSVEQPLLQGFGRDIVERGLRDAYDSDEISRLSLRKNISSAIIEVVKTYRELIKQNYKLENSKRQLDEALRNIETTKIKIQAGREARTQLVELEANYENLKSTYQLARNERDQARQNLLNVIGLDPELKIEVPSDVEITETKLPEFEMVLNLVLANDADYQNGVIGLRQVKRALVAAKNQQLPDLRLTASASMNSTGVDVGRALQGYSNFSTAQKVELSGSIPISNYTNKKALLSAEMALRQSEIRLEAQRRSLVTEIKNKITALKYNADQIESARRRISLSHQSYDNEKLRQQAGRSSSINVTDAQKKVLDNENSLIDQKIAYLNAIDDLNLRLGMTLIYWGIELHD